MFGLISSLPFTSGVYSNSLGRAWISAINRLETDRPARTKPNQLKCFIWLDACCLQEVVQISEGNLKFDRIRVETLKREMVLRMCGILMRISSLLTPVLAVWQPGSFCSLCSFCRMHGSPPAPSPSPAAHPSMGSAALPIIGDPSSDSWTIHGWWRLIRSTQRLTTSCLFWHQTISLCFYL